MNPCFVIYQAATMDDRPPISHKVREYFEHFITEEVLIPKKIIYGGKWKVILAILFIQDGSKVLFERIAMAKGSRTIKAESSRLYEVLIIDKLIRSSEHPLLTTLELMYEAVKLFLTTAYKKVTPDLMDELWEKMDLPYLLSLPYPAPFEDQKYVADDQVR